MWVYAFHGPTFAIADTSCSVGRGWARLASFRRGRESGSDAARARETEKNKVSLFAGQTPQNIFRPVALATPFAVRLGRRPPRASRSPAAAADACGSRLGGAAAAPSSPEGPGGVAAAARALLHGQPSAARGAGSAAGRFGAILRQRVHEVPEVVQRRAPELERAHRQRVVQMVHRAERPDVQVILHGAEHPAGAAPAAARASHHRRHLRRASAADAGRVPSEAPREQTARLGRAAQVIRAEHRAEGPGDAEGGAQEGVGRRALALGIRDARNLAPGRAEIRAAHAAESQAGRPAARARARAVQRPDRAVAAAGGAGDAEADVSAVRTEPAASPRHGEVLLRQRKVRVHQRGEVVRGVAAAAPEQRAVRAREPALGHTAHPAERAGGARARGVVPAAGWHGLPHGAHLFLGGVRGPAAGAAAAARRAVGLTPSSPRGRVGEHERGRDLARF
mmetsp:Transcript_2414/g.9444  ORF Transcript_2414/g.9444 Transcript_2414/m.9444 type:complete len:451 (-) Transcript_2414:431-1783(-)